MTSVSWDDEEEVTASAVRWKARTLVHFVAGRSRFRALAVVIHLLPEDVGWFSSDASLFDELKLLLRERVVAATGGGDKDAEAQKSRKRARKEELCVQGERLQFTYRYRKTLPRYTVLSYAGDQRAESVESRNSGNCGSSAWNDKDGLISNEGSSTPGFHHLPLSESTLLVWVYRFDKDDPYRPVPNEAALQFAPTAKPREAQPLDVEAVARRFGARAGGTVGMHEGPRDTGLLAWLWGAGKGDGGGLAGNNGSGQGGVRQHFIGGASWQGTSASEQTRDKEEDDIQRAIALSLEAASTADRGVDE